LKNSVNNLAVYTNGEANNTPIIFVHGFPFDHRMWDTQIESMKKNYFCVTYDTRGLGESDAGDGQYTMETFVDDLDSIINKLGLKKPVLCGLSMGGYISLRAIERMQEKFSALILCDTKAASDNNEAKLKRAGAIKRINEGDFEGFINEFVANCFYSKFISDNRTEYQSVLTKSKKNNPLGVKGCLLAMAARTDTSEGLNNILIPTLIICGSEDKLTPPDVMMAMADKIKNSEFILVEGAGHMTPVEKPIVVSDAIQSFLKKNLV
jgi:3-oxoadipate enol-lactonase